MPLKIFFFAFFWIAAGSFFATRENCLHFTLWQIYVIFHHSRKNCFKVSKYRKGLGSKKRGWACTFHHKQKEEEGWSFCKNIQLAFSSVFREKKNCSLPLHRGDGGPERAFLKKERKARTPCLQQRSKMWRSREKNQQPTKWTPPQFAANLATNPSTMVWDCIRSRVPRFWPKNKSKPKTY